MTPNVYFFGQKNGNYISYPREIYTDEIFNKAIAKAKEKQTKNQIALHRESNLMFYSYVSKLSDKNYFGISVCINNKIYPNVEELFNRLDEIFSTIVYDGKLLCINNNQIAWCCEALSNEVVAMEEYSKKLCSLLDCNDRNLRPLPGQDYSISKNEEKELAINKHSPQEIIYACEKYCNVLIVRDRYYIERVDSMFKQIANKNTEIEKLKQEKEEKEKEILALKLKQKNIIWVGIFASITAIMFLIIYFKVINPSEVTKYKTENFVYYGPIKDKKPHGVGVAVYYDNDKDGRKYYIGNFNNGVRIDSNAVLVYKNGSYFCGNMENDELINGMYFNKPNKEIYEGLFKSDETYDGVWYKLIKNYKVKQ